MKILPGKGGHLLVLVEPPSPHQQQPRIHGDRRCLGVVGGRGGGVRKGEESTLERSSLLLTFLSVFLGPVVPAPGCLLFHHPLPGFQGSHTAPYWSAVHSILVPLFRHLDLPRMIVCRNNSLKKPAQIYVCI